MPMHFLDIFMALDIFMGSSSIRTTSAASMAASEPIAPMAMPISARESTGASFMPSPTKASLPFLPVSASSFSTSATLSAGSRSLRYSSMPSFFAMYSATRPISPVSMTVFFTPIFFSSAMAALEVGFSTSDITTWPAYLPSMAMCIMVPELWQSM